MESHTITASFDVDSLALRSSVVAILLFHDGIPSAASTTSSFSAAPTVLLPGLRQP